MFLVLEMKLESVQFSSWILCQKMANTKLAYLNVHALNKISIYLSWQQAKKCLKMLLKKISIAAELSESNLEAAVLLIHNKNKSKLNAQ